MKKLCIILLVVLSSFSHIDSIYNIPIRTIGGETIPLSRFHGKKMLFIILPVSSADTILDAGQLMALCKRYDSSLVVIGVLSNEAGFNSSKSGEKARLTNMYAGNTRNFYLTEGLNVQRASGRQQSPVFQWLTNKAANRHFDQDVQGPGHKFFVDERGELCAVLGPQTLLRSPVVEHILTRAAPSRKVPAEAKPLQPQ